MTSRTRMEKAIHFRSPDRIPILSDDVFLLHAVPPQSWQPPEDYYPYVHPEFIRAGIWTPVRPLPGNWLDIDRMAIDEWGTIWRVSGAASQGVVEKGALEGDRADLPGFRPPEFSNWSRYSFFEELSARTGGDRYRMAIPGNSIWERFQFLRGFENALTDLIRRPADARVLLDTMTECHLTMAENFKRAGADGFMLVDDWGSQQGPMISPALFEEFFTPCYARIVDGCHRAGMDCGIHSCGNIRLIVPALIDIGFDFLQLDSPCACGIDWLAGSAAGKIALLCSPDIQTVYCTNDPALLEAHIKEQIAKLSGPTGGYAAWPYREWEVIGVTCETRDRALHLYRTYGTSPSSLLLDRRPRE